MNERLFDEGSKSRNVFVVNRKERRKNRDNW